MYMPVGMIYFNIKGVLMFFFNTTLAFKKYTKIYNLFVKCKG